GSHGAPGCSNPSDPRRAWACGFGGRGFIFGRVAGLSALHPAGRVCGAARTGGAAQWESCTDPALASQAVFRQNLATPARTARRVNVEQRTAPTVGGIYPRTGNR